MDKPLSTEMANTIPMDCGSSSYPREIHDPLTWRYLQEVYIETVDETSSERYERKREAFPSYSGFNVEVEVKDTGHRGRSVYAKELIAKGTRVWKPVHLVKFHRPWEMQEFLSKLDHDLQCDALLWAYVEKNTNYVALALDPASFVNHGEKEEVINLDEDCVALRDIAIGEELLEDYSHFIGFEQEEVEWFHQIRGIAWKEEGPATRSQSADDYNLLGAPKDSWTRMVGGRPPASLSEPTAALHAGVFVCACVAAVLAAKKFLPKLFLKKQKGGM